MVAELHPTRAQGAKPPLDFGHRRLVVLPEYAGCLLRHAVYITGCVVVRVAECDPVPVDKGVLVGARELVLVRQPRAAEPAALDPGAGEMAGRDVIVVRAIVDHRLPVSRLEPFDRAQ